MTDEARESFEGWAILELMGHRKLAGRVSEEVVAGASLVRIDVPLGGGFTTQFYSSSALYCLTPTTEKTARQLAATYQPTPVSPYEIGQRQIEGGVEDWDENPL